MASNKRRFKMWARYDGSHRLIPGSNIWAKKAPSAGNWMEVQAYECCNPTTTTTTTILISTSTTTVEWPQEGQCYNITLTCNQRGGTAVFGVYYCYQDPEALVVDYYTPQEVCCYAPPVLLLGNGSWTLGENCTITTTTTEEVTTTTTTLQGGD